MVLQVCNHTGTADVNGIHNVVSINRITLARTVKEATQATKTDHHDDVQLEADNTGDEYVVERIFHHKDSHETTTSLVQWHGYRPAVDTWELTHHIPQHVIRQDQESQRRAKNEALS